MTVVFEKEDKELIEVDLRITNRSNVEYFTNVVPRVGEIIDVDHSEVVGDFEVIEVRHRIMEDNENIINYVIVKAE